MKKDHALHVIYVSHFIKIFHLSLESKAFATIEYRSYAKLTYTEMVQNGLRNEHVHNSGSSHACKLVCS